MIIYTVKPGEALIDVAEKYNSSVNKIAVDNGLTAPLSLTEGQCLLITSSHEDNRTKRKKISVMSSFKPLVNRDVLKKIMPQLTYASIRSGMLRQDGSLHLESVGGVKALAKEYGALPVLEIYPSFPFNGDDQNGFFSVDMTLRISDNVKRAVLSNGYCGVNMNVAQIYKNNFEVYVELLASLRTMLEPWDIKLIASIPEKIILSEDMELLGEAVDYIAMLPQNTEVDLMDIYEIEDVLKLLCEVADPSVIALCVPMNAMDLKITGESEREQYVKYSTAQAVRLSMERQSPITYDESTCLSQFDYLDMERGRLVRHNVTFESLESLREIVLMGSDTGVGMLNVFNADKYYPPFWKMLEHFYDIEKLD